MYSALSQATLGVFAWTEAEKPGKLACRVSCAESAPKAKLLARARAHGLIWPFNAQQAWSHMQQVRLGATEASASCMNI